MPKCDFNKVARHRCSPVNLLHMFRTPFLKSTSGWLLPQLYAEIKYNVPKGKFILKNSSL